MTQVKFKPGQALSIKTTNKLEETNSLIGSFKAGEFPKISEKIIEFYNSVTDQLEWEVLLLCFIYLETSERKPSNSIHFSHALSEMSYRIPVVPSMLINHLQNDILVKLSSEVKLLLKKALNSIIEDALVDANEIVINQCVRWEHIGFEGTIRPSLLRKIICETKISKDTRLTAYFELINKEANFMNTLSVGEVKDICDKAGFKYSTYLCAVSNMFFAGDWEESVLFEKEILKLNEITDTDFDLDNSELDSIANAIAIFITTNNVETGFSCGIEAVKTIYEFCCNRVKEIIQDALDIVTTNLMLKVGPHTVVTYTYANGAGLREFTDLERKYFDELLLSKSIVLPNV